jgi:hypothetical protein
MPSPPTPITTGEGSKVKRKFGFLYTYQGDILNLCKKLKKFFQQGTFSS